MVFGCVNVAAVIAGCFAGFVAWLKVFLRFSCCLARLLFRWWFVCCLRFMDLVILCWFAGCDRLLVLDIVNSVGMVISLVMNV